MKTLAVVMLLAAVPAQGRLDETLTLASVTLRMQQYLQTVTEAERRAELAGLAARWYRSGVPEQEAAQWSRRFDEAAAGMFGRLAAAAQTVAERESALRTLERARRRLGTERAVHGDLTGPLTEAMEASGAGQGWFGGLDEEVERLLQLEAGRPAAAATGVLAAQAPIPEPLPGTTRRSLSAGNPAAWDLDLQREEGIEEILLIVRNEYAGRVPAFQVSVAGEGRPWQQVFAGGGGGTGGQPVRIRLAGLRARRVAVTWTLTEGNPFDQIFVYGGGSGPVSAGPPAGAVPVSPVPVPVTPVPVQVTPVPVAVSAVPVPAVTNSTINLALFKPTRTSSRSGYSTASESGGVDGIKNGSYGFHTNHEVNPWWQVDLQQTAALGEIRVFNRRDGGDVADRARTLRAFVSADGASWQMVHDQSGRSFGGDGQPLRIPLNGVPARWVRLQLNEPNWLHLDEVEIYGRGSAVSTAGPVSLSAAGPDILGRVWREQEGGFSGVWTRRGTSNVFDAAWGSITGVLTMTVNGNQVEIDRRGSDNCRYTGTISGSAVSGLFDGCAGGAPRLPWSAVIGGGPAARPIDAIFIPGPSGASGGPDTTTQGNWRGRYGRDGAVIVGDAAGIPFRNATVTPRGKTDYLWGETTDPRGLARFDRGGRLAGAWYAPQQFEVEIAPAGGQAMYVTAYFLDWDAQGRAQNVELIDALSNAVLETRAVSNFANGQYQSWPIRSRAILRITRMSGPNAVLNGLFLDNDAPGQIRTSNSVSFLGIDVATAGNWRGRYGRDGAVIAGDGATSTAFTLTPKRTADYIWGTTQEARALARRQGTERVAAVWYSNDGFDVEIQPPAAQPYKVTAYFLDWDGTGRTGRVEVIDLGTGAVLDTRTVRDFRNGQYLSWRAAGPVSLRLTRVDGPNVTLAGLFIDAE